MANHRTPNSVLLVRFQPSLQVKTHFDILKWTVGEVETQLFAKQICTDSISVRFSIDEACRETAPRLYIAGGR